MTSTPGGGRDLRKYMGDKAVMQAFGKLISGKSNYIPVIEKRPPQCPTCKTILTGDEKFCPECGTKVNTPEQNNCQ